MSDLELTSDAWSGQPLGRVASTGEDGVGQSGSRRSSRSCGACAYRPELGSARGTVHDTLLRLLPRVLDGDSPYAASRNSDLSLAITPLIAASLAEEVSPSLTACSPLCSGPAATVVEPAVVTRSAPSGPVAPEL